MTKVTTRGWAVEITDSKAKKSFTGGGLTAVPWVYSSRSDARFGARVWARAWLPNTGSRCRVVRGAISVWTIE